MKKQPILWFYPVWNITWFLVILGLMLCVKVGFLWTTLVCILLVVAEVPSLLYKKRAVTKVKAELDCFIIYLLGVAISCIVILTKLIQVDGVFAFLVGLFGMILLFFKMNMITRFMLAIESF